MNDNYKILLVEDEETLAAGLKFNLEEEGYKVALAVDGKKAVEEFYADNFDIVILDIMLPFLDGFEVAEAIRKKNPQTPILMLTARSEIKDKLKGLELGADDYMTKPFHLEELLLRVKGMLKRKSWYSDFSSAPAIFKFGENEINFQDLKCKAGNEELHLTQQEAMLLKYMIENENTVLSRKEILEKVWNITSTIETRTIDNFIVRFRKYFEKDGNNPIYFKSVRGIGYIFSRDGEN
ncbi:MAG: response regulator transcription factor [Spirochaetia bacterium]|jgi:DNA-binding response OmpR family regulator|nr:response regulator transcription factor [Spirochaetia bacterium]